MTTSPARADAARMTLSTLAEGIRSQATPNGPTLTSGACRPRLFARFSTLASDRVGITITGSHDSGQMFTKSPPGPKRQTGTFTMMPLPSLASPAHTGIPRIGSATLFGLCSYHSSLTSAELQEKH
jgi:hypothetical protein